MNGWVFAVALLFLLPLSGCLEDADTSKALGSRPSPFTFAPNFVGNWSHPLLADHSFQLYQIKEHLTRLNETTNTITPLSSFCNTLYTYRLDAVRRQLHVASDITLHPFDPGPLRVVYLNDLVYGPQCIQQGPWGINDAGDRTLHLEIPLDRTSLRDPPFLTLNLTIHLDEAAANGFRVTVNGHTFDGNTPANLTESALHPTKPWLRTIVRIELLPHGVWPYDSIVRD